MFSVVVTLCLFISCTIANYHETGQNIQALKKVDPQPYEFSYDVTDDDGNKHGRQETGDAQGNKMGYYSIQLSNGIQRWVEYIADKDGFRARIKTNEPGTDNKNPADVEITANPLPVVQEVARKVAYQRNEEFNPLPVFQEAPRKTAYQGNEEFSHKIAQQKSAEFPTYSDHHY